MAEINLKLEFKKPKSYKNNWKIKTKQQRMRNTMKIRHCSMIALLMAIHEGWEKGQPPLKKENVLLYSYYIVLHQQ